MDVNRQQSRILAIKESGCMHSQGPERLNLSYVGSSFIYSGLKLLCTVKKFCFNKMLNIRTFY